MWRDTPSGDFIIVAFRFVPCFFCVDSDLRDDECQVGYINEETALQPAHADFDGKLSVWR